VEEKEDNERWEKRTRKVRREEEVWELLNKKRKRRKRINEKIELEWKKYFGAIEGVRSRKKRILGGERKMEGEKGGVAEEKGISREEIKRAMKKLRNGKTIR